MNAAPDIADGVHFGLPDEVYHAIPALSASGIKNLLISGPDYWYRCSWLNPNYEDEETDTAARIAGRAYHKRILEGRDAFRAAYAETFHAPKGVLETIDEMKEALAGVAISLPSKARKPDYIAAVRHHLPSAPILDDLERQHLELHDGKEFISPELIAKIEVAAKMIECHPEIGKCFSGGYPEVTVIWTQDDIRFKARFDYLKPKAIIDLKTFANFLNKPIDSAIYSAMANGKYHLQAYHYLRAADIVKAHISSGKVFGNAPPEDWINQFTQCDKHSFWFVFQAKGIAPLARLFKFNRGSMWSCGEVACEQAIQTFRRYKEKYGDLPWVDDTGPQEFDDSLFPVWATEL